MAKNSDWYKVLTERTKFDSIEAIEAHRFAGNYHGDAAAFRGIEDFIRAQTDRDLQCRALGNPAEERHGH